jgi:hypothetical protein
MIAPMFSPRTNTIAYVIIVALLSILVHDAQEDLGGQLEQTVPTVTVPAEVLLDEISATLPLLAFAGAEAQEGAEREEPERHERPDEI